MQEKHRSHFCSWATVGHQKISKDVRCSGLVTDCTQEFEESSSCPCALLRLQSWRNVERRPICNLDISGYNSGIFWIYPGCSDTIRIYLEEFATARHPNEVCLDALNLNSADQLRQLLGDGGRLDRCGPGILRHMRHTRLWTEVILRISRCREGHTACPHHVFVHAVHISFIFFSKRQQIDANRCFQVQEFIGLPITDKELESLQLFVELMKHNVMITIHSFEM